MSSTAVFADGNGNAIATIIQQNPLVAKYVQDLQNIITSLTDKNSSLEDTVKAQQATIDSLNQSIAEKDQQISNEQKINQQLKVANENLQKKLNTSWVMPKLDNSMSEADVINLLGEPTNAYDAENGVRDLIWDLDERDESGTLIHSGKIEIFFYPDGKMQRYLYLQNMFYFD